VELCAVFGKSKQAYYKQLKADEIAHFQENVLLGLVKKKAKNLETWKWKESSRKLKKRP